MNYYERHKFYYWCLQCLHQFILAIIPKYMEFDEKFIWTYTQINFPYWYRKSLSYDRKIWGFIPDFFAYLLGPFLIGEFPSSLAYMLDSYH